MPIDDYGPVHDIFRGTTGITKVQVNGRPVCFPQSQLKAEWPRHEQNINLLLQPVTSSAAQP